MSIATVLPEYVARLTQWEAGLCRHCNRMADSRFVRDYFAVASRLGDGPAWYALLALLPLFAGASALWPVAHMAITAVVAVLVYKAIKHALGRPRPYAAFRSVKALVPALDQYSFPSGHTMHAVTFTIMLAHYYPGLALLVLPFAVSVAMSRVVLGLHYPTDVAAGALLGAAIARMALALGS